MPKIGLLMMLVLLTSACGDLKPPKRGAVESQARIGSRGYFTLRSSLNCAYPGEAMVFTLAIENDNPFDITSSPPIELQLASTRSFYDASLIDYWSHDTQYPTIDPILQPSEQRRYTWTVVADKRYAATEILSEDGMGIQSSTRIDLEDGFIREFPIQLIVGVRSLRTGTEEGVSLCTELGT